MSNLPHANMNVSSPSNHEKLLLLRQELLQEWNRLKRQGKIIIGVYSIVILALLLSTSYVFNQLNELIGPKGFEEQGIYVVNRLAEFPEEFGKVYMQNRADWAEALATKTVEMIPTSGEYIKNYIDLTVDKINTDLSNHLIPNVTQYVRSTLPYLRQEYLDKKAVQPDLTVPMFFAEKVVQAIDQDLDRIFQEEKAIQEIANLQQELRKLTSKNQGLTKRELAERKLLVSFMSIIRWGTEGSPILEELKKLLEEKFYLRVKEIEEEEELFQEIPLESMEEL